MSDPIPEAYAWLADAVRPYCDKVICKVDNFGFFIGIGCQWGDRVKVRTAIVVEREYECGLNEKISAGLLTQRDATKALLVGAPML